jgi:tyrosine-protein kinase Etk/Wzc
MINKDERTNLFDTEESIDIRAFLYKCFHHWYLFFIIVAIALTVAVLINRFTNPMYKISTFVLIHDKENPLDAQNLIGSSLYGNPYKIENEIGLIKSKSLTARALRELDFFISYYRENRFTSNEIYRSSPFVISLDTLFDQPLNMKFYIDFLNDTVMAVRASSMDVTCYRFSSNSNTRIIHQFTFSDTTTFGKLIGNQFCRFRIIPNYNILGQIKDHRKFSFQLNSLSQLVNRFRITDIKDTKSSSILQISLKNGNVQQGVDYLNKLTAVYLAKGIERDDKIASATIDFIDSQLTGIRDSLRYSEDKLQQFRSSRGVTNIDFQAQQTYQQMENLQDQKAQLIVKSKYYNYLQEYLKKNNMVDNLIAPSSMDINDPLLNNLIIELTKLYSERSEMSFNSIRDNPYLNSLESRISDIKAKLIENIDNIIKNGEISLREIDTRINEIEAEISKLPGSQRELLVIERKFKLNDAIYTFLLTRRSEMQISKASNIPSNEILDPASEDDYVKVSPNTRMNYILALLLGLLVPATLIYLKDYFRNKIEDEYDIRMMTDVPVIGHIIHNTLKNGLVVHEYPSSIVAESFRTLRTNFQFFSQENEKNVILITSIIKGEGKSFTSVNLGTVFAQNRKKVVVIDFDLRKARIHEYLGIVSDNGLSRYLSHNTSIEDIIFPSGIDNLDVIPSGPIPPNPTELISSAITKELFNVLSTRYDIVLIDSPPIALVSDALLLLKFANIRILVVRQNFTPRNLFAAIIGDLQRRNIDKLNIVINDERTDGNTYGYGYGYGYGIEEEKGSMLYRIRRLLKRNSYWT